MDSDTDGVLRPPSLEGHLPLSFRRTILPWYPVRGPLESLEKIETVKLRDVEYSVRRNSRLTSIETK